RPAHHRGPLARGGVARAHADPQVGGVEAQLGRHLGDLAQGALEVLGDVDRERLERRHVDDLRPPGDVLAPGVGPVEAVDADEEPGQRLARTGGRGDERVAPLGDVRPPGPLRGGGAVGEAAGEPRRHGGVERVAERAGVVAGPRAREEPGVLDADHAPRGYRRPPTVSDGGLRPYRASPRHARLWSWRRSLSVWTGPGTAPWRCAGRPARPSCTGPSWWPCSCGTCSTSATPTAAAASTRSTTPPRPTPPCSPRWRRRWAPRRRRRSPGAPS